jgi:hypothetical protein
MTQRGLTGGEAQVAIWYLGQILIIEDQLHLRQDLIIKQEIIRHSTGKGQGLDDDIIL